MSSAIEVLESEKVLYVEKIKEIESRFNGMPFDIKESYQKSVKVYQEFIDALGEAIVALEKQENYVIDFIRLEVLPKSKKEQFRVFFKDGTEQVFQMERVGEQNE